MDGSQQVVLLIQSACKSCRFLVPERTYPSMRDSLQITRMFLLLKTKFCILSDKSIKSLEGGHDRQKVGRKIHTTCTHYINYKKVHTYSQQDSISVSRQHRVPATQKWKLAFCAIFWSECNTEFTWYIGTPFK